MCVAAHLTRPTREPCGPHYAPCFPPYPSSACPPYLKRLIRKKPGATRFRAKSAFRSQERRVPRSLDGSGDRGEGENKERSRPHQPQILSPEGGEEQRQTQNGSYARRSASRDSRPTGGSRPISRVLSWTAIHLGCASPHTSRDLPGSRAGRTTLPYLVLLRVGFTLPPVLPPARCALTAPFHPYRAVAGVAVYFLWHFP